MSRPGATLATVLLIDDNASIRSYLSAMLQAEGHRVREAANGVEGITLYRQEHTDLVICDLFMPEKEGIETIRELHDLDPGVRVIAISGGGSPTRTDAFLAAAKQCGAVEALAKPFGRSTFLSAVEQALRPVT